MMKFSHDLTKILLLKINFQKFAFGDNKAFEHP